MNPNEDDRFEFWLVASTLVLFFMLCIGMAHCATTSTQKKHGNELGITQYQDNPYTYKVGALTASGIVDDAIVLRIQPLATYNLFTEDILFCDKVHVAEMFEGKRNPFVLTYRTQALRLVQGVGCHTLVRVDNMQEGKP